MNRRDLLHTTALATAASLLPRSIFAAQPLPKAAPAPIRLGMASYTFRKFDSAHLIDFMHQLKLPFLNLKDAHLKMGTAAEVAAQCAAYRAAGFVLTAAGTITFNVDTDEDIRPKFEYLKAAGIPIAVCAPTHAVLPRLEKFVKEYNIKLAIHNHGPEDKNFPSPLDVLAAVKNLDSRIGCCIDVGHCMRAGTDPVAAVHAAGPRLFDMHMKDLAKKDAKESQVAVGQGIMPVRGIFHALTEIHYPGCVDLEYEIFPDNPMPGVVESFAYMRGVISGMGLPPSPTTA
jgi:sugar phosphate isomerase/epimerase